MPIIRLLRAETLNLLDALEMSFLFGPVDEFQTPTSETQNLGRTSFPRCWLRLQRRFRPFAGRLGRDLVTGNVGSDSIRAGAAQGSSRQRAEARPSCVKKTRKSKEKTAYGPFNADHDAPKHICRSRAAEMEDIPGCCTQRTSECGAGTHICIGPPPVRFIKFPSWNPGSLL